MSKEKGGFTLPGEAGYEQLTLRMAEKWGADVIRDSDGTELSPEILRAGYGIYSTVCLIRGHNEWASENKDALQQSFLITKPRTAKGDCLKIPLMEEFFEEQFQVDGSEDSIRFWQVYDRTCASEVPCEKWTYDPGENAVEIRDTTPFHTYTVSFLAYRIWEEISMYNHTTNSWDKEHLMPIEPRHEKTRKFLLEWMEEWCREHPATTVVRFTSLFYNFAWIWGSSGRCRSIFSDWGSYDFTVSKEALKEFEKKYGYSMTAEDFVNGGKYQVTHMPPADHKRDWMEFIVDFVVDFGRQLVDIVHRYGKQAYVFYDDSWIGIEPWGSRFKEFGFDGLIKCVFSGYEARLCAGVDVPVHELRLHPYLFPVGLGGAPTFVEGGQPARDAREYWNHVRRALMREPVQRIGLGGYLHLTEDFPDFQDYIEEISDEFRRIVRYHEKGKPYTLKTRVAVLHCWGRLRSWTLSGHFHETYMHDLIHVNEALSGLPVNVEFISFDDVRNGALENYDVLINAGRAGSAWSGGDEWRDPEIVGAVTRWVWKGGILLGIHEPSAVEGCDTFFRMAHVLGVDKDMGARVCHGKWQFEVQEEEGLLPCGCGIPQRDGVFLTDGKAQVLKAHGNTPDLTVNRFGNGYGIYLGGFSYSPVNARMLLNLIRYGAGDTDVYLTDNPWTECAYYPQAGKIVVINNSAEMQRMAVNTEKGKEVFTLEPYGQAERDI